jgi:hypothetical protein
MYAQIFRNNKKLLFSQRQRQKYTDSCEITPCKVFHDQLRLHVMEATKQLSYYHTELLLLEALPINWHSIRKPFKALMQQESAKCIATPNHNDTTLANEVQSISHVCGMIKHWGELAKRDSSQFLSNSLMALKTTQSLNMDLQTIRSIMTNITSFEGSTRSKATVLH